MHGQNHIKFELPISHCSISSVLLRNCKPLRLDIVEWGYNL